MQCSSCIWSFCGPVTVCCNSWHVTECLCSLRKDRQCHQMVTPRCLWRQEQFHMCDHLRRKQVHCQAQAWQATGACTPCVAEANEVHGIVTILHPLLHGPCECPCSRAVIEPTLERPLRHHHPATELASSNCRWQNRYRQSCIQGTHAMAGQ